MSRCIDADWIIQKLERWRGQLAETYGENDEYVLCLGEVLMKLDDAPTADVRENVKGMWVEVVDRTEMYDKEGVKTWGMLFQCNQCGFVLNAIEGHTGQYNYCPNCGADMRRKDNER